MKETIRISKKEVQELRESGVAPRSGFMGLLLVVYYLNKFHTRPTRPNILPDGWTNIVAIAAGHDHTVGLRADGTVIAIGDNW
jgi:alpha-tubulin suppressor-like RCC1 family protein